MNAIPAPHSLVPPHIIDDLIAHAKASPAGAFVEVGVYKGGTAWYLTRIAEEQSRPIFLYDTFTGIPYQGPRDRHKVGDFNDTSYVKVCQALPYAKVVMGLFPASAIPMPAIAFAHLDCDQYQSIVDAVHYLRPLMVKGGIIWFDDTTTLDGAKDALDALKADGTLPDIRLSTSQRHYAILP